jgi:hypothetical protein
MGLSPIERRTGVIFSAESVKPKSRMASTFARVPPSEWCLGEGIPDRRRQRLLHGLGFASIVRHIAKQATVLTHKRTRV